MKEDQEHIEVTVGSENIFEDFGYPNPEESKAKADLAIQIRKVIESKGLTQQQAAKLMGLTQPKVSDITRGKLSKFTIDKLLHCLLLLGSDIEIVVSTNIGKSERSRLRVTGDGRRRSNSQRAGV